MADHGNDVLVEVLRGAAWRPVVGPMTSQLKDYLLAQRVLPDAESANRVIGEAFRVLSQCDAPNSRLPPRTGLVCGYVQSGKTASMTAVAALAKDNGFRIIVLIAGVTTILLAQNRDRMETQLREAAPEWTWLMMTNPKYPDDLPTIEPLVNAWRNDHYEEADRRTLFITVMKHHAHLHNLAELLSRVDLQGIPAIVFDDEADQASLNTRPNDPIASTTYRNIEALRRAIPNHTYLQYTATPQAPLLITRIDSLSADFAELVSPGEAYTGGEEFFRRGRPLVETIPPEQIFPDGRLPADPPESLLRAMQVFFVGVAIGRLSGARTHRSMLIHPSRVKVTHRRYYDWANQLKDVWHRVLLSVGHDRDELLREFDDAYRDLTRSAEALPAFDVIAPKLPAAMNQTTITLVNSEDAREVPWRNSYAHVLVGGEKLGRGYTVKGLTVTYMPRPPGGWTADTIQQRARFFGYHREYLGLCRVYLHNDVRATYEAYVTHEADMRTRLAEHRGLPLREWRRMFYLDERLAPTRRNVLTSPWMRAALSDGWFAPRAPHLAPEDGAHNTQLLSRLDALVFEPDENYPRHAYAVAHLRDIFEQILMPMSYFHDEDALGLCVVNCNLKSLIDESPDARCLIYLMDRGGQPRERSLTRGSIPQFFQGRSSAGAQSYPGDRAFADRTLPTLQLHSLRLTEGGHDVATCRALAVRLGAHQPLLVHDEN